MVHQGGFLLPLLSDVLPALASYFPGAIIIIIIILLRKMYLVPDEKYPEVPKKTFPSYSRGTNTGSISSTSTSAKEEEKEEDKKTETTTLRKGVIYRKKMREDEIDALRRRNRSRISYKKSYPDSPSPYKSSSCDREITATTTTYDPTFSFRNANDAREKNKLSPHHYT